MRIYFCLWSNVGGITVLFSKILVVLKDLLLKIVVLSNQQVCIVLSPVLNVDLNIWSIWTFIINEIHAAG